METIGAEHTTADYSEGSTVIKYSPEDLYAKAVLKRSGLDFEIADISKGILTRLQAKVKGITQTPTLIAGNDSQRRFVGIKEIQKFLADKKN